MTIIKQASALTDISALILLWQTAKVAMAICQDERAVIEKKMFMEKRFLFTAGFTKFRIPQNKVSSLNNLPS